MPSPSSNQVELAVLIRAHAFGGSERHTVELVNYLTDAGWRVTLIQSGMDLRGYGLQESPDRLEVVSTELPTRNTTRADRRAWDRLLRAYPAERALLVKSWYYQADLPTLRLLRHRYPRVYHIEHSLPPELGRPTRRLHFGVIPGLGLWWYRNMRNRRRMSWTADRVLAVSEESRRRLLRDAFYAEERLTTCPNGVDLDRWVRDEEEGRSFRLRHGLGEATYLFGVVSRLVPLKGVDLALHAFAALAPEPGQAALCIIGDGPCRELLEGLGRKLGIADRVYFLGHRRDMRAAYSALDTLLLPSTSESFSLALVEAMACGCRPIAAAVGAIPEVLGDGTCGDLIHVRGPQVWAAAMRRHLATPAEERACLAGAIRAFTTRVHDQRRRFEELERVLRGDAADGP